MKKSLAALEEIMFRIGIGMISVSGVYKAHHVCLVYRLSGGQAAVRKTAAMEYFSGCMTNYP